MLSTNKTIQITECPRDAMQGIHQFIPTQEKINYLLSLLEVGFAQLDAVSFVSPKAIPQLADSKEVMQAISPSLPKDFLIAIIANLRGAKEALEWEKVAYLGFPLSVSPTFQQRNTNKNTEQAFEELAQISLLAHSEGRKVIAYLSMAFGNPYGEQYSTETVLEFIQKLAEIGVYKVALSDTIGSASDQEIRELYSKAKEKDIPLPLTLHLHARADEVKLKMKAGIGAGCSDYDGALLGFGGCPMAKDGLVGNMSTELMIELLEEKQLPHSISLKALAKAKENAHRLFQTYH